MNRTTLGGCPLVASVAGAQVTATVVEPQAHVFVSGGADLKACARWLRPAVLPSAPCQDARHDRQLTESRKSWVARTECSAMALSAFDDETAPPTDRALEEMLGRATQLWTRLKDDVQEAHGPLIAHWNFSGKAYGWSFRLTQKKRAILYMTPCRGYFLASLALGEKACRSAHAAKAPPQVLAIIDAAPKYAEGRGVRLPVRGRHDLNTVESLVMIKVNGGKDVH